MYRVADGHPVTIHGGQAHHAGVQRPVGRRRQRRGLPTSTDGRGATAVGHGRRGGRGRRQPAVGRRVPARGRRGTATGRRGAGTAAAQVVVQTVAGRGRWPAERPRRIAATQQRLQRRRQQQGVRRDGICRRAAIQPHGRGEKARRRRMEEQRVQPVRQ